MRFLIGICTGAALTFLAAGWLKPQPPYLAHELAQLGDWAASVLPTSRAPSPQDLPDLPTTPDNTSPFQPEQTDAAETENTQPDRLQHTNQAETSAIASGIAPENEWDSSVPSSDLSEVVMEELREADTFQASPPSTTEASTEETKAQTAARKEPQTNALATKTPTEVETDIEILEASVWTPFYSQASAQGFAQQLSTTFAQPFAVRRRAPAHYEVVYPHEDPQQWAQLQSKIRSVFGGP